MLRGFATFPSYNPQLGWHEQNPEDWWQASCKALAKCMSKIDGQAVVGLALSNQRETIAFVNEAGDSVYPAITWVDERCRHEVKSLSLEVGADRLHNITGVYPDVTSAIYSCEWMRKNQAQVYEGASFLLDVNAYLVKRLCSNTHYQTSFASADPMGFFDLQNKQWSEELLQRIAIDATKLAHPVASGSLLGEISQSTAQLTGLPEGLPVFAGGGDGQCAALGVNCIHSNHAYVNLGTAVVSGVWSPDFRASKKWRIKLAIHNQGYLFETVMRSGTLLLDWFARQWCNSDSSQSIQAELTNLFRQIEAIPIGSHGVMVQPYWLGVMDPHWDYDARGLIIGLSASHSKLHIFRAIIEAMTISQISAINTFEEETGHKVSKLFAVGGGSKSDLWMQMFADASGREVVVSDVAELSSLGAAMVAAFGVGWYVSISEASSSMSPKGNKVFYPNPKNKPAYDELADIYAGLYEATAKINLQLVNFAEKWGKIEHINM